MRLFVSVDLDGLADRIRTVQAPFRGVDGLRPVDPADAHVTLKFLGDTDPDRLPAIERALETAIDAADVAPFTVRFGGLGVFPDRSYISVVWLGVRTGGAALTALHEAVEARLTAIGVDPADHAFTPHVTLARMDHAGPKAHVLRTLDERDPDGGRLEVTDIRLTESTLTDDGPVYETRTRVPL